MTNKNLKAVLKSENTIEITVKNDYPFKDNHSYSLTLNGKTLENLKIISKNSSSHNYTYILLVETPIKIGYDYQIKDDLNEYFPLDITCLTTKNDFYTHYNYKGQLGCIYSKEQTTLRVFSPLASNISVKLTSPSGDYSVFALTKDFDTGTFEVTLNGDYENYAYVYVVKINGEIIEVVDPYAVSVNTNSQKAYIIDINKVKEIPSYLENLPSIKNKSDLIIYECSVRDMTSLTNISNRGTYSALSLENLKENNQAIGLDYIASLGVNAVQLLPVYDFQTGDDSQPFSSYNWGYDPKFYFAPEGSYSTDPNDPYKRLIELKTLVSSFHKKGIRVIMDVVFNHVYSVVTNSLQGLCPDLYFRKNNDGSYSNGSFCGNDLESRNYMCRRLIIESMQHFVDVFGFDGFRFDLMGIIDIDTLKEGYAAIKALKDEVFVYGEGWDMPTNLPFDKKGTSFNSSHLLEYGFFNDSFRDISKGKTNDSELGQKGYLSGDVNYIEGFKYIMLGSCIPLAFPPMFSTSEQSINYVECHDNATLFDKLKKCCADESLEEILKRIKMVNAAVMFASGVPFFHMGQEVGLSKNFNTNSYKAGDLVNGMNYQIVSQRKELIQFFKDLVKMRTTLPIFKIKSKQEMMERITFHNLEKGALAIKYSLEEDDYYLIFNPTKEKFTFNFENKYLRVIFNETGSMVDAYSFYSQNYIVNPLSVSILKSQK